LDISRDEYALCDYIQFRLADPRGKSGGWCYDTKHEIAEFIGISRPGLYKMMDRMEQARLLEIDPPTGFARVTGRWIDSVSECKQSLQDGVNKVYNERKQSLQDGVNKVTLNKEKDIKREKIDYQQEEKINVAVFDPSVNALVVDSIPLEAEKKESPKVALKGSLKSCPESCSPIDYCDGGKCDRIGCYIPVVVPPPSPSESLRSRFEPFDIDKAAAELKGNTFSAENFARITGTPAAQMTDRFPTEVDVFTLEQKGRNTVYNRFDEFSGHFFNYERAKVRSERNDISNAGPTRSQAPPPNFQSQNRY
jgi:hypothetical protein